MLRCSLKLMLTLFCLLCWLSYLLRLCCLRVSLVKVDAALLCLGCCLSNMMLSTYTAVVLPAYQPTYTPAYLPNYPHASLQSACYHTNTHVQNPWCLKKAGVSRKGWGRRKRQPGHVERESTREKARTCSVNFYQCRERQREAERMEREWERENEREAERERESTEQHSAQVCASVPCPLSDGCIMDWRGGGHRRHGQNALLLRRSRGA